MAEETSPAFQFYVKEWRSSRSIMRMTFAQRGMYLEMLLEQWENLTLPDDPAAVAELIGGSVSEWRRNWEVLRRRFLSDEPGRIYNVRLEKERTKQASRRQRSSDSGVDGARGKWRTTPTDAKATRAQRLSAARELGTHTDEEWQQLLALCAYRCVRCGVPASALQGQRLVKDHIRPVYMGGDDSIRNLQPMCRNCNSAKGPDTTDHRKKIRGMPVEWLASVCETPGETPGERLAGEIGTSSETPRTPDSSISFASSIALATADARVAREDAQSTDDERRAGRLREELYPRWYSKYRNGARLRVPLIANSLEYQDALSLVRTWPDDRLEKLARIVLTTNDEFIAGTDRGFKIFALKAGWADNRLCEIEKGAAKSA